MQLKNLIGLRIIFILLAIGCESIDYNKNLNYTVMLIDVDSTSVSLEIRDDNQTAIDYTINCSLYGHTRSYDDPNQSIEATEVLKTTLYAQTKSIKQLDDKEKLMASSSVDINGKKYNIEEKENIRSKIWFEGHRFTLENLESNMNYQLKINISAKEIENGQNSAITNKIFEFTFTTTFNINLAAQDACKYEKGDEKIRTELLKVEQINEISLKISSDCYIKDSNCTKCKSNCFQIKPIVSSNDYAKLNSSTKKIANETPLSLAILCDKCPCDESKSTGECEEIQVDLDKEMKITEQLQNFKQIKQQIRCKQCKKPYTGQHCDECESDGIDYYMNADGECLKCECNKNAALDDPKTLLAEKDSKRRKCQDRTGL
jgi:hypothetical protein